MKKSFSSVATLFAVLFLSCLLGCKGEQKGEQKEVAAEPEKIDYAALLEKEMPPLEVFDSIVHDFNERISSLNENWDECAKNIKGIYEPKGFTVSADMPNAYKIKATKNGELLSDEFGNFSGMKPVKKDSLSAAAAFYNMGDMYVAGSILVSDSCVYDAIVQKIKAMGYKQQEKIEGDEGDKYQKDFYFYICMKEKMSITLHLDFMAYQEASMGM